MQVSYLLLPVTFRMKLSGLIFDILGFFCCHRCCDYAYELLFALNSVYLRFQHLVNTIGNKHS